MLTAEARVMTDNPSRYIVRMCRHAASIGRAGHKPPIHHAGTLAGGKVTPHAEWSDTMGTIILNPWGKCLLEADADSLIARVEAADEDSLLRIQGIITSDLTRFTGRQELMVEWRRQ